MTSSPPPRVDLQALRLDDALALLRHGGMSQALHQPDGDPSTYLQAVIDGLCELSLTDPLTGLSNRRRFRDVLAREIEVVARSGNSALLLMLDIDHFKRVNDTHGHRAGDQVLQAVAKCIASCIRPQDTVARYGGEEFAIVLPDCQVGFGDTVAERIRQTVAALTVQVAPEQALGVTVSIGGAFAPLWIRSSGDIWVESADAQLYRAKASGRNCVRIDQQPIISVSAEEKRLLFGPLIIGEPAWLESTAADTGAAAAQRTHQ